ncbi:hypothetical protein [Hymenobacter cavernae]|uniref:DNA-binding protein n=1 Tax=Hymenobacter cavernae TaxID=2044852 RepID=A0ABQ1UM83_9BACT|nr:hypothetical protein [Hymenobacter cavernae]GGF22489.1 hypothetical protein GCM10011383_37650 [Hymenobacter cavernae]
MASLSFVTPDDLAVVIELVQGIKAKLDAYIESVDDEIDTATALKITGIKSRTTLIAERDKPGSLLKYSKLGTRPTYSRSACIEYKLSKRLNAPAMRLAS